MKKVLFLFSLLLCTHFSFASFPPPDSAAINQQTATQREVLRQALKTMTVKGLQRQTGKKLTLREKLRFAVLKAQLRKAGDEAKGSAGNAIGGFALGFFLLPIGVLIAYLLPKNKPLRTWAWIGFGAGLLALLFLAIAVGSLLHP